LIFSFAEPQRLKAERFELALTTFWLFAQSWQRQPPPRFSRRGVVGADPIEDRQLTARVRREAARAKTKRSSSLPGACRSDPSPEERRACSPLAANRSDAEQRADEDERVAPGRLAEKAARGMHVASLRVLRFAAKRVAMPVGRRGNQTMAHAAVGAFCESRSAASGSACKTTKQANIPAMIAGIETRRNVWSGAMRKLIR
jgi:hypothetical protein